MYKDYDTVSFPDGWSTPFPCAAMRQSSTDLAFNTLLLFVDVVRLHNVPRLLCLLSDIDVAIPPLSDAIAD